MKYLLAAFSLLLLTVVVHGDEFFRGDTPGVSFVATGAVTDVCQGCSATSPPNAEACTTWRQFGLDWDNEGIGSFWNLFGAFSNENICKGLNSRAGERTEEVLRTQCNVQRNQCVTLTGNYNTARNLRTCAEPSCILFFLFCNIECKQISCIYDLNCDP